MILVFPGCAQWNSAPAEVADASRKGLPAARVPDSAAIIDVIFVPLPAGVSADDPEGVPWRAIDESVLPAEVRRRLMANGIRAGRVLTLRQDQIASIAEEDESTRLLRQANVASDFESRRRRLSCRQGRTYPIVVRRALEGEVPTMIQSGQGVIGKSLRDPQFNLRMSGRWLDDGRVAVRLVPVIEHGKMQQNVVASDSLAFRFDFSRPSWSVEDVALEVPLSEDQAVVILATDEAFGLGKQMFVGRGADGAEERTAVVFQLSRRPLSESGK